MVLQPCLEFNEYSVTGKENSRAWPEYSANGLKTHAPNICGYGILMADLEENSQKERSGKSPVSNCRN